jgi:peptidyl-prolyl cis-trans isomerase B (cyclophilin B)
MKIFGLRLLLVPITALIIASCGTRKKKVEEVRHEVTLSTTKGDIVLQLFNETPLHRDNFLQHVESGYYDSLLFHRVIENFMIQSGDSTSRFAEPGVLIADESDTATVPAEFRYPEIFHKRGVLAAARTGDDVNPEQASSASQFYIVWGREYNDTLLNKVDSTMFEWTHGRHHMDSLVRAYYLENPGSPHLDGSYTVFGQVVSGLDVVDSIQCCKTDTNDRPIDDIRILKAIVTK